MRNKILLTASLFAVLLTTGCPEEKGTADKLKNARPQPRNGDKVITPTHNAVGVIVHPADGGPAKIRYADGSEVLAGEEITVKVPQ